MKYMAFPITSCMLCSCSTPTQNYYPDKIKDTAFYVGKVSYRDNYDNNEDYKDTILVIRIAKDSIALIAPDNTTDLDLSLIKSSGYWTFPINGSGKYIYRDSTPHVHYFTLYDFSSVPKLDVQSSTHYKNAGLVKEYEMYTFSGKRRLLR